jgi:MFS family permease
MLVMPFFFIRLGVKWMLAFGMFAWVLRYAMFALGAPSQIAWMIIFGIVLHGICYDFFFVTGQIYTDQVAPRQIRAQAQGMLVLFTLGLGMFIGAQIAGRVEAQHTPQASKDFAAQVTAKGAEIETVRGQLAAAPESEKVTLAAQITALESEQTKLRQQELAAIEWRPLWGKPAIFAAIVLVLFVFLFRNPGAKPADSVVAAAKA